MQVTNNVNNADRNGGNSGNNEGCTYKEFLMCKPIDYDGTGGAVVLTRWVEKMESVMDISGCTNNRKVWYATTSLINKALTWWNTQIQARGCEAAMGMTWEDFKALMVEEFHELAKLVPHLVTPESKLIDRYIHGLVPQIRGMIRETQPIIIVEKRKEDEGPSKQGGSWSNNKIEKVGKGFVATGTIRNEYADFSLISIEFMPLLNVKPIILRPSYVIEVSNGKKVETDRIIQDCVLELWDSLFTIDLIPFGDGSFDVIVGWIGY
ncbi:hypothetical protein Tco_1091758 [Tanacetum coccineum]|uniref:Reverse transcriptase domain-containing protein n=1 Tax=Tanacetum coccineum TaxID=301880 RepID=A0ABQ5I9A6_9ASTR